MRWVFRIVGAFVVFAFLVVALFLVIPAERIAQIAADRLAAQTGRSVEIAGDVRPTLWPDLGVRIEGMRIGNPDWAGPAPMIEAGLVDIGVAWAGLLSGDIRVERAVFTGAELTLVRGEDGRTSWAFDEDTDAEDAAAPEGDADRSAIALGFDRAEITEGRLTYIDRAADQRFDIRRINAVIGLPESGGAASIAASAVVEGTSIDLSGTVAGVAALMEGGTPPMRWDLAWPGGTIRFDGRAALDASLEGQLDLAASDLGPLLSIVGVAMPDLPAGFGRDRVAVTGDVTVAQAGSVHLRNGVVRLDETRLNAALDLVPGEDRPMLRGTVTGGAIALPGLLGGEADGTGTAEASATTEWPRDVIDVSGLFATDADLTVRAESLDLGAVALSGIDLRATLTRGRLVFDIAGIEAYGGQIAGQFVINGRGGLSVGGDLILANAQLQPLLQAMAGYDRLQGSGSASIEFLGVGNDLHTIMSGLEAEGDVTLGQGAILGLDLAGMIRNLDAGFRGEGARTVYDRVTAEFRIRDGILLNEDLFLTAPWGDIEGEGRADLGAMEIDYTLTPTLLRDGEGQGGVRVPILIRGPWSGPSIRPDLEALAEQQLAEEAARLEEEARARLAEEAAALQDAARLRAEDLIGVDLGGDSGEVDPLREVLGDDALDGLQQLLLGGSAAPEEGN